MQASPKLLLAAVLALALVAVAATAAAANRTPAQQSAPAHVHTAATANATSAKAAALRVTLDRLLGEHVLLATAATQRGLEGGKEFPALSRSLDRNSVELANAIGSVYGKKARNQFLNGRFMWRDHIRFFVSYTVALARKDTAGQERAVANLRGYIAAFSAFLSRATDLPRAALRKSITTHVIQLKGQLDAYATGNYARSYTVSRKAYAHMFMTGDTLAAAIVAKFPRKFR